MNLKNKKIFMIVAVNTLLTYTLLLAVTCFFDYYTFNKLFYSQQKTQIEQLARKEDQKFYHNCLKDTHLQALYPALFSSLPWRQLTEDFAVLPLGAQPQRNLSYCNEGYGIVTYRSDRFGFRNQDQRWNSPVDLLLVGDSYTQGACVPNDSIISEIISTHYQVNTINVASGSNGPQHYFHLIHEFVPIAKPKNLAILFYPNDNTSISADNPYKQALSQPNQFRKIYTQNGLSTLGKKFFLSAEKMMRESYEPNKKNRTCKTPHDYYLPFNDQLQDIQKKYGKFFNHSSFNNWVKSLMTKEKSLTTLRLDFIFKGFRKLHADKQIIQSKQETAQVLKAALDLCQSTNCKIYVVLLPHSQFWRPDPRTKAYYAFIQKEISRQDTNKRIQVIKDFPDLIALGPQGFAPSGPHLSKEGYEAVSKRIALELQLNQSH